MVFVGMLGELTASVRQHMDLPGTADALNKACGSEAVECVNVTFLTLGSCAVAMWENVLVCKNY